MERLRSSEELPNIGGQRNRVDRRFEANVKRVDTARALAKYGFTVLVLGSLLALVTYEVTRAEKRSDWQTLQELGFPLKRVPLDFSTQDFQLTDQLGRAVQLSQYPSNTVILLHFWATDCPPCLKEFPDLEKMITAFAGSNIAVLAVSRDKTRKEINAFVTRIGGTSALLLHDPQREVFKKYGVVKVPETFVIKDRTILARFVGSQHWENDRFLQYIRLLLRL